MMKMKKMLLGMLAMLMSIVVMLGCASATNLSNNKSYEKLIFDTARVHTIDITMSKKDRAEQMKNPKDKTKYRTTVTIDGEKIEDVAFHTKGNSSLYLPISAGKDKYSYGLDFGKYTNGKTYHGLDKLDLQNNFSDGTAMKEYMAYWLFNQMGVKAPLASFVWLKVNGEVQGLYTALEEPGNSFLDRIAKGKGTLYKPEDGGMGLNDKEMESLFEGNCLAHNSDGGANLKYKDDKEESYPDIFENAQTTEYEDTRAKVIRALKALSEKKDLEKYLETKEIIKYFAIHNYLVNYDSYTGLMLHNYCLYEHDGKLSMLPWDYDISFGTFPKTAIHGALNDSTDIVNTGIDSPLGIVDEKDRPMWSWIVSDENYRNEYHEDMSKVIDVIESGTFKKEAKRVYDLIVPYIKEDPKGYFNAEKSKIAFDTYLKISDLRAQSISKQLEGKLATRSDEQNKEDQIDVSKIVIRDMGSSEDLFNK